MKDTLIECHDLIKIYETETKVKIPALRGIDMTIKEGDLIAIIGPSGAGKTTLVNVLGMLMRPSSGEIIYNHPEGQIKYSKASLNQLIKIRQKNFGFVKQQPEENLFYRLTSLQNILFSMKLAGKFSHEEGKKYAFELLETLGIKNKKDNRPAELSGGEAQRLSVCVALANDPQIIFADEPTGELDSLNTYSMIKYFQKLNDELGKTFIVVTHDRRFSKMTNLVFKIQDGRVSTLQKSRKGQSKQEEFIYISDDGTFQIPRRFRERYKLEQIAKLKANKDHFKVFPVKDEDENSTH